MLLGHTAFAEQAFQDARLDAVHNIEFAETGFGMTFSIGDETAFGEAFQNLITFSTGSPDFFVWNETDDSQTVTWKDVEPGSSD
tara:strand:- start:387 stop:638 length:252 start_codon:yes stop_codon:yes gene_type:complete